jgi:hypothetical protein
MSDISKKAKPGKKESKTEKKQFWSKKSGEAHKDMKEAKRTGNTGWVKMLKKRLAKYHSHTEATVPTFSEYLEEKKKRMKNTCWDGYKPIGTKTKNGKQVPNCVPESVVEESMDNPYPYQWSERDGGYIFFPDPKNQSILYTVLMLEDPEYPQRLTIMFHYTDEDKNIQGTADMTGTGKAFRVMATVLKIANEYLDSKGDKYNMIRFSAKSGDHGRHVLYKRLAHQLKNKLGPRWELDVFKTRHDTTFELSKAAF